jgi:ParB-like chromosome segregation protein Spo0J
MALNIRDRVIEFIRVPASSLRPSPRNWRTHGTAQRDALKGILAEVGYAGAQLARRLPDGSLELIDGHLRAETVTDQPIPVLVTDVNEDEAAKLLATYDPNRRWLVPTRPSSMSCFGASAPGTMRLWPCSIRRPGMRGVSGHRARTRG